MIREQVITAFQKWHESNLKATRLQRHEVMKATLFNQGLSENSNPTLEYKLTGYSVDGRSGIIDYLDMNTAIEIDDGCNEKSLKKLSFTRNEMGRYPLWILILSHGNGGRSRRIARKYGVDVLRIFARSNNYSSDFLPADKL